MMWLRNKFDRHNAWLPRVIVGVALVLGAVGWMVDASQSDREQAALAQQKSAVQSDKVKAERKAQAAEPVVDSVQGLCDAGGNVARILRDKGLCDQAEKASQVPEVAPVTRAIAATDIVDGHLIVSYTDGSDADLGRVRGYDGRDGKDGRAGGDGEPGVDGRSIVGTAVVDGQLVISYSDGSTAAAGDVVGPVGPPGRGVANVAISPDYHLIVTYTDGETADVGPLPPGPRGPAGRGIASVSFNFDTCQALVTYTDGSSEQAPMTGCEQPPPEPEQPGP